MQDSCCGSEKSAAKIPEELKRLDEAVSKLEDATTKIIVGTDSVRSPHPPVDAEKSEKPSGYAGSPIAAIVNRTATRVLVVVSRLNEAKNQTEL